MRITGFFIFGTLLLSACGTDSGGGNHNFDQPYEPLSTEIPPISSGDWYRPDTSTSWQWQLVGTVNSGYAVEVYDIDLFDNDSVFIQQLQASGKRVICYYSAGSYEEWREDAADFDPQDLGRTLDGWADERWLNIRSPKVLAIMEARLDLAVSKGCDGVEPDNMDGYSNANGFGLTADDQLAYNRLIANAAHQRGLSVGLKNDLEQIPELLAYFDFSVNEQCHEYHECEALTAFIEAGKPVFNAEYDSHYLNNPAERDVMCTDALALGLRTLILPLDLDDSFRYSCDTP